MSRCQYVRKVDAGYERGFFLVEEAGTKNEKRTYKPLQVHKTMQEALAANDMAIQGHARVGSNYTPFTPWVVE